MAIPNQTSIGYGDVNTSALGQVEREQRSLEYFQDELQSLLETLGNISNRLAETNQRIQGSAVAKDEAAPNPSRFSGQLGAVESSIKACRHHALDILEEAQKLEQI